MAIRNRIFKFSHRSIQALPPQDPAASSPNVEFTDSVESGLKIAVYKSGRRSFRHRYTFLGVKKMMTLGEFPAVNVDRARERVRDNKALLAEDTDPQKERQERREAISFSEFADEHYLPFAKQAMRSYRDVANRIKLRLKPSFGEMKLERITKPVISKFHLSLRDEISAITANRYLALVSSMFSRAIEIGLATENPCRGISKFKENGSRERVLAGDEMESFMLALKSAMKTPQGKAVFLLLATGLRKSELLSWKWSDVDWGNKRVSVPHTKSGKPHMAVLNTQAYEVLRCMEEERDICIDWVFPSDSALGHLLDIRRTFKSILASAGIKNLRIHDMRRSFASILINRGVPIYEVRDLLNHADIRTTQVYARLNTTTLQNASEKAAQELEKFMA